MHTRALQTIDIPTGNAQPVRADLYLPSVTRPAGLVIICHGLKGHRRWGFFPFLGEALRREGLAALSIDFSHNGTFPAHDGERRADGEAGDLFTRPDLFARNTLRREYEDLRSVIDALCSGKVVSVGDDHRRALPVGLIGHSRGGVAVVLCALERPVVKALCTWSTTHDPDFYTASQKSRWREAGAYRFTDSVEGTPLEIGIDYLDDLERNHEFYWLERRIAGLRVPHLIVHGTQDLTVPVESALRLHEAEQGSVETRLVLLQTGHTFGLPHPVPDTLTAIPGALGDAMRETAAWFVEHLGGG